MRTLFVFATIQLFLFSNALPHSGRTDSCGGHNDRKRGGYHVHNSTKYRSCYPPSFLIGKNKKKVENVPLRGTVFSKKLVIQKCFVTNSWLQKASRASTNIPQPSNDEMRSELKKAKINSIWLSFNSGDTLAGTGTLVGQTIPYFITERYIGFMTANNQGGKNSVLDRHTGLFTLNLTGVPIEYSCK